MDRKQIMLLALLGISVAMLIAGIVMLAVGIHKAKKHCDKPIAPTFPAPPNPDYSQLSALFLSTHHDYPWDDSMSNKNSVGFKNAQTNLSNTITTVLSTYAPHKLTVNKFLKDSVSGIEAYSTIFYSHDISDKDVTSIQEKLSKSKINCKVFSDPISQCNGQPFAPPNSNPTTNAPTPPPSIAPGVTCDASSNSEAIVILVDIAVPAYGNYSEKLSSIRSFLHDLDSNVNLNQSTTWNQQVYLIPYYGNDAYTLDSSPCMNHACWALTVNQLTEQLNQNNVDSHNLAVGLQYVSESLGTQLKSGVARSLIILTDGMDFRYSNNIPNYVQILKKDFYTISAILVSTSHAVYSIVQRTVTDDSHFYAIPDFMWINNDAIKWSSAQWICQASYPTQPPVTSPKTAVPLITTTTPTTRVPRTIQPPSPTPYANCIQNVVFLIDESQTMLDTVFNNALTFASQLSQALANLHSASRFAIVTFNSKIVFSSKVFITADELVAQIKTIPMQTGVTNYTLGFNSARQIISQGQFNNQTIRPLVVFVTDGDKVENNNLASTLAVTTDLRHNYRTEIIALGVNPASNEITAIKKVIGVDSLDTYPPAIYSTVANGNDLIHKGTEIVIENIHCQDIPTSVSCGMDITFVIETSYAMASYIEIEKQVIYNTIENFKDNFGPFSGKISVVYFSTNKNNLVEGDRSGILYQQLYSVADAENKIMSASFTLGGSSDIKTGLELATQIVSSDMYGNDQLVILFTRGIYVDGNATNCCDNPADAADALRKKTTIQGVLIGYPADQSEIDSLAETSSINANSLIKDPSNVAESAQEISHEIGSSIQKHISTIRCQPIPSYIPPCAEYIDVTIAWHGNTTQSFNAIRNFISKSLLPSLFGGVLSNRQLTRNSPINIALATIDSFTVNVLSSFESSQSPAGYAKMVDSVIGGSHSAPAFSKLYNATGYLKRQGRNYASNIILIVTDDIAVDDIQAARNTLNSLPLTFAQGIVIGSGELQVTGTPINIGSIDQLNIQNLRSSRSLANMLSGSACKFLTTPAPVTEAPTTTLTTPYPIPIEKPRDVWPDITILVDTTFDNGKGMTDRGFQIIREFVDRYFLNNMYIGDYHSRVALVTFGEHTNIACDYGMIHNYFDFKDCLKNYFIYDIVAPHSEIRNLAGAIDLLKYYVFNVARGNYIPLKENFLLIFTTGASTTDATKSLQSLQAMGIRTIGFDLGQNLQPTELSVYGMDSISVPNWMDENSGLLGNNNIGKALVDSLTSKHRQSFSRFFADFYFIIDESLAMNGRFDAVRTFVYNFVSQLTISEHRSRVAIVPFALDVLSSKLLLTDNRQTFEKFFNDTFQYQTPGSGDANIGAAISLVQQYINASKRDRANYVIYITSSSVVIGNDKGVVFQNSSFITPLVLQTNPQITYSNSLAPSENIFRLGNTDSLNNWVYTPPYQNNMTNFFNHVGKNQEQYREDNALTLNEIDMDFAFAVDLTGLNAVSFENVKQYLVDFVSQYYIGPDGTQFSMQLYNGRMIVDGGFHFSDNIDKNSVINKIKALKYKSSDFFATQADLISTLVQINEYFMTPQKGWRNGPTYVIMLSSGQKFYQDPVTVAQAKQILRRAKTSMIQVTDVQNVDFVKQFVNDYLGSLHSPDLLTLQCLPNQQIEHHILKWFTDLVFPTKPSLHEVQADFFILIDNNNRLETAVFNNIKKWLNSFVTITLNNFNGQQSRMAVISYNANGVIPENTFGLDACGSQSELIRYINRLNLTATEDNGDIVGAVNEIYKNKKYGYDPRRPIFVVDIASSTGAPYQFGEEFSKRFNKEVFTFAYLNGADAPYDYINEFLGPDGESNYVSNATFVSVDTTFTDYIVDSYASWKATF